MQTLIEDLKAGNPIELPEKELQNFLDEVHNQRELISFELAYDGQGWVRIVKSKR